MCLYDLYMYTWEPLTILSENLVIIISENPISNMFFCNFIENLPENLTFSAIDYSCAVFALLS